MKSGLQQLADELHAFREELEADNDAAEQRDRIRWAMEQNELTFRSYPRVVRDYTKHEVQLFCGDERVL